MGENPYWIDKNNLTDPTSLRLYSAMSSGMIALNCRHDGVNRKMTTYKERATCIQRDSVHENHNKNNKRTVFLSHTGGLLPGLFTALPIGRSTWGIKRHSLLRDPPVFSKKDGYIIAHTCKCSGIIRKGHCQSAEYYSAKEGGTACPFH